MKNHGTVMNNRSPQIYQQIDLRRSGCVEASAGTGKTYTIEHLVCRILEEGDWADCGETPDICRILIITYTEKAAGELKIRLRRRLGVRAAELQAELAAMRAQPLFAAGAEAADIERRAEHIARARRMLPQATIATIHAFCTQTLAAYSYVAGAAAGATLVDDREGMQALLERRVRDVWPASPEFAAAVEFIAPETLMADVLALAAADGRVLPMSGDAAEDARQAEALTAAREISGGGPPALRTFISEALTALAAAWQTARLPEKELAPLRKSLEAFFAGDVDKDGNALPPFIRFGDVKFNNLLSIAGGQKKAAAIKAALYRLQIAKDRDGFQKKLAKRCSARFAEKEAAAVREAWTAQKRSELLQSYDDMVKQLHSALAADDSAQTPPLAGLLRRDFRYGIIDEFQDTNNYAWEICRKIFCAAGKNRNHLYVVGDPKQSIYSFQGANLFTYFAASRQLSAGHPYRLTANFRSAAGLIEACNALFAGGWFTRDPNLQGEHGFTAAEPGIADADYAASFRGETPSPVWLSPENITLEEFAAWAAAGIRALLACDRAGRTALQIPDGKSGSGQTLRRNLVPGDIAILAHKSSELQTVERIFTACGVPCIRYKDNTLFTSDECFHWSTLLKAVALPGEGGRWQSQNRAAVLTLFFPRHPAAGALPAAAGADAQRCLQRWRRLAAGHDWARLVTAVLADSGVEARLAAENAAGNAPARIRQLADYILTWLERRDDLGALTRHLDSLYAGDDCPEGDNSAFVGQDSDREPVRLMTIHAAKGLEFPVTVLAGGSSGAVRHDRLYRMIDPQTAAPLLSFDGEAAPDGSESVSIKEMAKRQSLAEYERLYYVALTRARFLLLLPRFNGSANSPAREFMNGAIAAAAGSQPQLFDAAPVFADAPALPLAAAAPEPAIDGSENDAVAARLRQVKNAPARGGWGPQTASFSSLHKKAAGAYAAGRRISLSEENDDDLAAAADTAGSGAAESPAADGLPLPPGLAAGDSLHALLENCGFAAAAAADSPAALQAQPEFAAVCTAVLRRYDFNPEKYAQWTAAVVFHTLRAAVPAPWAAGGVIRLCDIPPQDRRAEMQFQITGGKGEAVYWGRAEERLHNIVVGFMDLVFRTRDAAGNIRWNIVDWKSNSLPDYGETAVRANMERMDYTLQRALYACALHHWLSATVPGYTYADNFGGVFYAFLRGTCASSGRGWNVWRPASPEAVEAEASRR